MRGTETISRKPGKTVPDFALYGTEAKSSWMDLVHFERIPERSSLFNWEIEPHVHNALIQVLYAVSGGGETFIDDRKWSLRTPCLIIAPARSVHGFHFSKDIDGVVVTAAQRLLESVVDAAAPELRRLIRTPAVIEVDPGSRQAESLVLLFEAIEREAHTHSHGQVSAGMSLLVALLVQVARIGRSTVAMDDGVRTRKAAQIERFRSLLDERCRQRVSVEHYARDVGVTAGQLSRLCHEVLGMSTLEAINARVVHEARRELVYSSLTIKQIAAALGFDDEAYFARFFKKQTGARPTEFREAARRQLATV